MDTKKIAATFAILMIALGVAGFAYAHWEKIVYVDGTVTTGTLHVTPSLEASLWAEGDDEGKQGPYDGVATLDYEVYPEDNYMEIWLDNVYPCLWVKGYIDLENDGSIPVNLVDCYWEGNETISIVYVGTEEDGEHYEVYDGDLLIANLWLSYDFPDGYPQIDPGSTAYIDFALHFKEDLPQGVYYWFYLEFTFWNWNESP